MKWSRHLAWRIDFAEAAKAELGKLGKQTARRIIAFLRDRLAHADDPRSLGEALKGSALGDFWRYRVGDYRIIANIEDQSLCVLVLRIGHRKDVYRRARRKP